MIAAVAVIVIVVAAAGTAIFLLNMPTGTLDVSVTDAPTSGLSHLYLTVSNIELQGNGNVTFNVSKTKFDLLALTNVTALLGSNKVPTGNYTMIRFTVTGAVATISGQNVTLTVPSGEIKVPYHVQVSSGKTTSITLDITADMTNTSASGNLRPVVTVKQYIGPS